jgi:hypothetical protein
MEINHGRITLLIDPTNPHPGYPVRVETKITAAAYGEVPPQEFEGGRGYFY